MLSGIATLLGYTDLPDLDDIEDETTEPTKFKTTKGTDGWLIVDKKRSRADRENAAFWDDPCVSCLFSRDESRGSRATSRSNSDITESVTLPNGVEPESWLVTPPPCFTVSGSTPPASPLENLLIEHPSMSVYVQHQAATAAAQPPVVAPVRRHARAVRAVAQRQRLDVVLANSITYAERHRYRRQRKQNGRRQLARANKCATLQSS